MKAPLPQLLGLVLALALAACGGGGGGSHGPGPGPTPPGNGPGNGPGSVPPAAPAITRFDTVSTTLFVGDSVRVRAEFTGGQGRIEPEGLAVLPGSETQVGPLNRNSTLRLVVSQAGHPDAARELSLRVDFRNRYLGLGLELAVSQHAAVATGEGQVLVIGGSRGEGVLSSAIDRYDPRNHTVARIGQLSQGRAQATAVRLDSGQVLVAGGEISGSDWRLAELVDERSGAVSPAGRMSVTRSGHAAIALPGGKVLVSGGITSGEGAPLGLSRSAELWDPATREFRRLGAAMLEPRANHTMGLLPDGRVLIVGGYSNAAQPLFAEIFDPRTEQFSSLFVWLRPRAEHGAFVENDGRVLVVGGEQPQPGREDWVPTASVLRFDPATNAFSELPPLALARSGVRGALTPDGEVLLFGGFSSVGTKTAGAERYDPRRGGQAIAAMDHVRAQHSVTRLPSGRIAVIGGEAEGLAFADRVQVYE